MRKFSKALPGLLLCFAIAAVSWWLLAPVGALRMLGPAVFSIFIGMVIGTAAKLPGVFTAGVAFASKRVLQLSVILLGFEMNIGQVLKTGGQSLAVMAATLAAAFLSAFLVGRLLRIERNTNILIGVGTAICGGSAIAATAPVIGADDREISHAISTIFLFNIAAVFLFPPLGHALQMGQSGFGLWAGTAINDTSSVVAAAAVYGSSALQTATIVKLTRTLMIIPVTLFLSVLMMKTRRTTDARFRFKKVFPWFVLGFLAASLICTVLPSPPAVYRGLSQAGKFCICMAMAAIGLKTNLVALVRSGGRPILLGFCCWATVAAVSLLVQSLLGRM